MIKSLTTDFDVLNFCKRFLFIDKLKKAFALLKYIEPLTVFLQS